MNCTVCKWEGSVYNLKNAECENSLPAYGGLSPCVACRIVPSMVDKFSKNLL